MISKTLNEADFRSWNLVSFEAVFGPNRSSSSWGRGSRSTGIASLPKMLGSAIAHEIGHLLLRSQAHSAEGIMQARWRTRPSSKPAKAFSTLLSDKAKSLRRKYGTTSA